MAASLGRWKTCGTLHESSQIVMGRVPYEMTIFWGSHIHENQLFLGTRGTRLLTHNQLFMGVARIIFIVFGFW